MKNNVLRKLRLWGIALCWGAAFGGQKLSSYDLFGEALWYFPVLALLFGLIQYGLIAIAERQAAKLLIKEMAVIYGYTILLQIGILTREWIGTGMIDLLMAFDLIIGGGGLVICWQWCLLNNEPRRCDSTSPKRETVAIILLLLQHVCLAVNSIVLMGIFLLLQFGLVDGKYHMRIYRLLCWISAGLTGIWTIVLLSVKSFPILAVSCLCFDLVIAIALSVDSSPRRDNHLDEIT